MKVVFDVAGSGNTSLFLSNPYNRGDCIIDVNEEEATIFTRGKFSTSVCIAPSLSKEFHLRHGAGVTVGKQSRCAHYYPEEPR